MINALVIMVMVGFFIMCAVKMAPHYMEHSTVRSIVQGVAGLPGIEGESLGNIRRQIDTGFNTNRIEAISIKDVKIYREKGEVFVDASYEARVPIMLNIEAVMVFDDLKFRVGDPTN